MAVLISCIGLPFRLIVTGNNLIKTKFLTSLIKNSFLILFIIIFYKEIGFSKTDIAIFVNLVGRGAIILLLIIFLKKLNLIIIKK